MKKKSFLIVLGVCIGTTGFVWGTNDKPLYKNPDAPIENRVEDLLRRMTLQEKVLQLQNKPVGRIDEMFLADRVMDVPMKWAGQQKNVPESITSYRIIC